MGIKGSKDSFIHTKQKAFLNEGVTMLLSIMDNNGNQTDVDVDLDDLDLENNQDDAETLLMAIKKALKGLKDK